MEISLVIFMLINQGRHEDWAKENVQNPVRWPFWWTQINLKSCCNAKLLSDHSRRFWNWISYVFPPLWRTTNGPWMKKKMRAKAPGTKILIRCLFTEIKCSFFVYQLLPWGVATAAHPPPSRPIFCIVSVVPTSLHSIHKPSLWFSSCFLPQSSISFTQYIQYSVNKLILACNYAKLRWSAQ